MKKDKYDKIIKKVKKFAKNTPPEQLWNLDYVLIIIIYHKIKAYRKCKYGGYPSELTPKKWKKTLKRMERGFKAMAKGENWNTIEEYHEMNKSYKKTLKLFSKWLPALWT